MNGDLADALNTQRLPAERKSYHENGKLKVIGFLKDGMKSESEVKGYDKKGILTHKEYWENVKLITKEYYENGKLIEKYGRGHPRIEPSTFDQIFGKIGNILKQKSFIYSELRAN